MFFMGPLHVATKGLKVKGQEACLDAAADVGAITQTTLHQL